MLVGNDVVDLHDPQSQPEALHPRFDARVFSLGEREALGASSSPHSLRWSLWAAKESAYKLAKKLDEDRPGWKEDTTVLMDGASYHGSQKTRDYFAHNGIRTMYTAPYSYSGSPIELWFAALKSTNLNPTMQATGKR